MGGGPSCPPASTPSFLVCHTSVPACLPACLPADARKVEALRKSALWHADSKEHEADIHSLVVRKDFSGTLRFQHPVTGDLIGPFAAASYVLSKPPESIRKRYKDASLLTHASGEGIKEGSGLIAGRTLHRGDSFKAKVGAEAGRRVRLPHDCCTITVRLLCSWLQGRVLTSKEAANEPDDQKRYHTIIKWPGVLLKDCFVLVPDEPFRYINSADTAEEQNVMMWSSSRTEIVVTVTARSIRKGEELLAFYGFES